MTVIYSRELSDAYKTLAEPLIEKYKHILPSWVDRLEVWSTGEGRAEICCHNEYRTLRLFLGPEFVTDQTGLQETTILHEFCHAYTTPLNRVAREVIEDLSDPESPGFKIADRWLIQAHEECTCDLEALLTRLLRAANPVIGNPITH